jgi:PII-like signaling protein
MERELQPAMKLTISVGGDERRAHHPLYQEVLRILHNEGISGATLIKGVMSFGVRRSIHSTKNEISMENLPIIIEAIDAPPKVERVAAQVAEMLGEHGLVELQPTMVACPVQAGTERNNADA